MNIQNFALSKKTCNVSDTAVKQLLFKNPNEPATPPCSAPLPHPDVRDHALAIHPASGCSPPNSLHGWPFLIFHI